MKVKMLGIELILNKKFTLKQFFDHILNVNNIQGKYELKFADYTRLIYLNNDNLYYYGLILTIKDQKIYIELVDSGAEYDIKINELSENSKLSDFNFFLINSNTCKGLYQYYHNSCSLNTFGQILRKQYHIELDKIELDELSNIHDKKNKIKLKEEFKKILDWNSIVKSDNYEKLIENLKSINSFDINIAKFDQINSEFRPIQDKVVRVNCSFKFNKDFSVNDIFNAIKPACDFFGQKRGKIIGINHNGNEEVISVEDNLEIFAEYELDDVISEFSIKNPQDFMDCDFINKIKNLYEDNKYIFEKVTEK